MATGPRRRRSWAGWLLGFALGGFFDGIVLHQVLQWHHLLSAVQGGPFEDLRVQLLADGLFHVLMYVIAVVGMVALWRAPGLDVPQAGGRLAGDALLGFGSWHVVDAVVSHWWLRIHRIRMDVPEPLWWDLGWLLVFGVVPLLAGLWLRRPGHPRGPSLRATSVGLVLAVLAAAPVASLPPDDSGQVLVMARPGDTGRLLDGVAGLRGGILWGDRGGRMWVFALPPGADGRALYGHGAALVTRSPALIGCLAFTRRSRG